MANDLTPVNPSPKPTSITSLMSPRLWTLVSSNHDANTEIAEIAADPELHREAKAVCAALANRASGAGESSVKLALQPLVLVYGVSEATKSPAFWQAYRVLAGLPVEALQRGIEDYLAAPDSQFFPKPGPLKALCDKHAEPIFKAAFRAARAAALSPPRAYPKSEAQVAAVARMAAETAEALKEGARKAWPERRAPADMPNTAGKPDSAGLTPQMRATLERQGYQTATQREEGSQ